MTYWDTNNRNRLTYYDEDGVNRIREILYHKNTNIFNWEILYREEDKRDVLTYWDTANKKTKQIRYFQNGINFKWDTTYQDNNPIDTKIYSTKKDGNVKYIHQYNEYDKSLIEIYNKKKNEIGKIPKINDLIESKAFAKGLAQQIDLLLSDDVYIEDFKGLEELTIDNKAQKDKANSEISENSDAEKSDDSTQTSNDIYDTVENDTDEDGMVEEEDIDVLDTIKGIGFLHNLEKLKIVNTNLYTISDEIGQLDKLTSVDVSNNNIHTIDDSFKNLKKLETLNLSENQIKNPSNLFDGLIELKEIDLSNNDLNFIPEDLVSLSKSNLKNIKVSTGLLNIRDTDVVDLGSLLESNILHDSNGILYNIDSIFKADIFTDEDKENLTQDQIIPGFSLKYEEYSKKIDGKTSLKIYYNENNDDFKLEPNTELSENYVSQIIDNNNTKVIKSYNSLIYNKSDFEKDGKYVLVIEVETKNGKLRQSVVIDRANNTAEYNGEKPATLSDLPIDIVDGIQSANHTDSSDKITSNQGDIEMSIEKENGGIAINNSQQEDLNINISIDGNLKYEKNDDGTVKYNDQTKNYNVSAQLIDGGARYVFDIENENAPKEYKIDLELPENSKIVPDGNGYKVLNSNDETITLIGAPWAVDNSGNFIETSYEIRGDSLYQKVDYSGTDYPLMADPAFCNDTINNTATKWYPNATYKRGNKKRKGIFRVYARTCTKIHLTAGWAYAVSPVKLARHLARFAISDVALDGWSETRNDASFKRTTAIKNNAGGVMDQFMCHAVNPGTIWKSSWNLEPGRPNVSLIDTYKNTCNP